MKLLLENWRHGVQPHGHREVFYYPMPKGFDCCSPYSGLFLELKQKQAMGLSYSDAFIWRYYER